MKKPKNICLTVVWQVHAILPNAYGMLILFYLKTGSLDPVDINSIQYIVSHIGDQRKWGLVDHSGLLVYAVFDKTD